MSIHQQTLLNLQSLRQAEQGAGLNMASSLPELTSIKKATQSKTATKANFKKTAPIIAILLVIIAIVIGLLMLLSPATLIMHVTQTIVDRFDTQQTSAESRANLLLNSKWLDNQPTSEYKIINDYRRIPEVLVKNLEKEGFQIQTKNQQIKAIFFKNKPISRQEFLTKISTDVEINQAKNNSYNSKRVLFQDIAWQKHAHNLRLSKHGFTGSDHSINNLKQQELEITKIHEPEMRFNTEIPSDNQSDSDQSNPAPHANLFKSIKQNLDYINQQADQTAKAQESPFYKSFNNLKLVETDFINNQSACGLYHNSKFLQNYAKTPQAGQQSRLAFNLFIESEKIKAGLATPESTEFYGKRLTETFTTTKADGTKVETKAGTDSVGYKYAAFGDTLELDESAERYVIGASPSVAQSLKTIENSGHQCDDSSGNFLSQLFSQFFSNLASLLQPFKLNNRSLNNLLNSGKSRQLTENTVAAMANLKVAPNTTGEDLVNSSVASAGHLFGRLAAIGGNNILSKKQAMAYLDQQSKYLALQGQIEAKKLSPFDTSSKHTFLGSIVHSNLHLFTKTSSVRSLGQGIIHSAKLSLAKISPISQAKNLSVNHQRCQDPTILKLNQYFNGEEIALDIFCNPIYGVDVNALKTDPSAVIRQLIASGDLQKTDPNCRENCDLQPAAGLANYQKNCIDRAKLPIGDANSDLELDDGASCLANSPQKSLYALYFIDQRLNTIFNEINPL